jgi:hypothetical protein
MTKPQEPKVYKSIHEALLDYAKKGMENYDESMNFCDWCYNMAGQPKPQYDMSFEGYD